MCTDMIILISDIHLTCDDGSLNQRFLSFLDKHQPSELYILGDLFDFWIGDDALDDYIQTVMDVLRRMTSSICPVHFISGNRDFLIGKEFANYTGINLLSDCYVAEMYGKKTLLLHGDLLCTDDIAYMHVRKQLRSQEWQQDFLGKDIKTRYNIAMQARRQSQIYGADNYGKITDANPNTITKFIQDYQVEQIIYGHTHRPKAQYAIIDGTRVLQVVLGAWHKYSWHVKINAQGTQLIAGY